MVEAAPKPTVAVAATIPAGQSLSDVINITTGSINMVIMPPAWTGAYLTLQVSIDNVIWGDVWEGTSEVIRQVFPGSAFALHPDLTQFALYVRFRSGTRDKPVPQEEDRVFQLAIS
jgi:hypothetical protein